MRRDNKFSSQSLLCLFEKNYFCLCFVYWLTCYGAETFTFSLKTRLFFEVKIERIPLSERKTIDTVGLLQLLLITETKILLVLCFFHDPREGMAELGLKRKTLTCPVVL